MVFRVRIKKKTRHHYNKLIYSIKTFLQKSKFMFAIYMDSFLHASS